MTLPKVNSEQAKLLRAFGFNWPCDKIVVTANGLTIDSHRGDDHGYEEGMVLLLGPDNHDTVIGVYPAPTVALALKWLRDQYKIWVFIDRPDRKFTLFVETLGIILMDSIHDDGTVYDTYEEAESAGLDRGLKYLLDRVTK